MLHRGAETFTTSVVDFLDHDPGQQDRDAFIYIGIQLEQLETLVYAMIDTGASFSIINPEIAENAGLDLSQGESTTMSTRIGPVPGRIIRAIINIPAKEGTALAVDATIFVPDDSWPLQNFIGYNGLLERIRFGISPFENEFHFGAGLTPRQPTLL